MPSGQRYEYAHASHASVMNVGGVALHDHAGSPQFPTGSPVDASTELGVLLPRRRQRRPGCVRCTVPAGRWWYNVDFLRALPSVKVMPVRECPVTSGGYQDVFVGFRVVRWSPRACSIRTFALDTIHRLSSLSVLVCLDVGVDQGRPIGFFQMSAIHSRPQTRSSCVTVCRSPLVVRRR
jgi:hypothetical protein